MTDSMVRNFIFFPETSWGDQPENWSLTSCEIGIPVEKMVNLNALWFPSENLDAPTLLLSHGNAGNISHRIFKIAPLVRKGFQVMLYDYRGFGRSSGDIKNEKDLYDDGEAVYQWLTQEKKISPDQIILVGESIGCAVALELAGRHRVRGVILESPFSSLIEIGKIHYPFLPAFLARNFQFNNREKIKNVKAPLLHIHGTEDAICPFSLGEELFEEANEPKEMVRIDGADHNNILAVAGDEYFERIEKFIKNTNSK